MAHDGGLLRRLAGRQTDPEVAEVRVKVPADVPAEELARLGVDKLLEAVQCLSDRKQLALLEQLPGIVLELDNGTRVMTRSKKEQRRFLRPIDPEMLQWLERLSPGDVFYDIGANCGSLALAAGAMHGAAVEIVAIEPGYMNFESMVRNLSLNNMLGFVVPLQVALLDRTHLAPLNYNAGTEAGLSLHAVGRPVDFVDTAFAAAERQMVLAYALDDLLDLSDLPQPTHVKIDVDGVEGALLEGAARTLTSGAIRDLLVEVVDHDRAGTRLAGIRAFLGNHGYELAETFQHGDAATSFVADHLFRRS